MRALSAMEVLEIWEAGVRQHPIDRALTILTSTGDRRSDLARLTIGERDRRLWEMRDVTLGPNIEALIQCPACGERIEFAFSVADVRAPHTEIAEGEHEFDDGEWSVRFRLPNSADLAAVAGQIDPSRAEAELAARCLVGAQRKGIEEPLTKVPTEMWSAVQHRMSSLDPQAEVSFELSCPACGHQWQGLFDIAHFFWLEIAALARRLLREIDLLARIYGWSESEILSVSPTRRQAYLELAGS